MSDNPTSQEWLARLQLTDAERNLLAGGFCPHRHIRPIGLWHEQERIFILLGAFEKSGRIYTPASARRDAQKYKAHYESGRGAIDDHR